MGTGTPTKAGGEYVERARRLAPATFAQVIEEIAKADASTAWCMCQASGCSMSAGHELDTTFL